MPGVEDVLRVSYDEVVVDGAVIGTDDDRIGRGDLFDREGHKGDVAEVLGERPNVRIDHPDLRSVVLEMAQHVEGGRLAGVPGILLVGNAQAQQACPVQRLATLV